jgi:hypothetical protein
MGQRERDELGDVGTGGRSDSSRGGPRPHARPVQQRRPGTRLLVLEAGSPIYLSGDWHHQLQGIHFAVGITETITGAGWTLNLELAPSYHVVGSISPTVPARVWDSATYAWSAESRTWNAA